MIFLQLLAFILAVAGSASGNPEVFTIKVRKITTVLYIEMLQPGLIVAGYGNLFITRIALKRRFCYSTLAKWVFLCNTA